jgi:phospholipid-binding lipoprotein MlaA
MNPGRASLPLLCLALALAGCATVPSDPAARAEFRANHDPIEPLNRKIFSFNLALDRFLIKPLAQGYQKVIPEEGRNALRHFLDNLNEPIVLANTLLQGRFKDARTTGCRFIVNSTAGIGGLADVASHHHLPKQIGDLGQTFWAWGFSEGPYLMLPLFGPSNPRDGIGMGADVYLDPFRYLARKENYPNYVTVGRTVADGIDKRARNLESVDVMQRESVDYYASLRSLFRQNRAAELRGSGPASTLPSPDFYADPAPTPSTN